MDMEFQVGQSLTFGFDVGGAASDAQQSAVYGNISCIKNVTGSLVDGAISGTATREEET